MINCKTFYEWSQQDNTKSAASLSEKKFKFLFISWVSVDTSEITDTIKTNVKLRMIEWNITIVYRNIHSEWVQSESTGGIFCRVEISFIRPVRIMCCVSFLWLGQQRRRMVVSLAALLVSWYWQYGDKHCHAANTDHAIMITTSNITVLSLIFYLISPLFTLSTCSEFVV